MNVESLVNSLNDFNDDNESMDRHRGGNRSMDADMVDELDVMPFTELPVSRKRKAALSNRDGCLMCLLPAKGSMKLPPVLEKFYQFEEAQMKSCDENNFYIAMTRFFNQQLVKADMEQAPRDSDNGSDKRIQLYEMTPEQMRNHYEETEHTLPKTIFAYTKKIRDVDDALTQMKTVLWRVNEQGREIPDPHNMK